MSRMVSSRDARRARADMLLTIAAHAASSLGVLGAIAEARPVAALASSLGLRPDALERLLGVLEVAGLVRRTDEGVVATAASAPTAPAPPVTSLVVEVIRRGTPLTLGEVRDHPEVRAIALAPDVARRQAVALESTRHLVPLFARPGWCIDFGCGIGLHAAALLSQAPLAHVVLVDRAPVLDQASRLISAYRARFRLMPGDLLQVTPSQRPWRAAMINDVLHTLAPHARRELVRRALGGLEVGGTLVVGEIAPDSERGRLFRFAAGLFSEQDALVDAEQIRGFCDGLPVEMRTITLRASADDLVHLLHRQAASGEVDDLYGL